MWTPLLLCATLFVAAYSWPSQVPPKACSNLTPVHPNKNGQPFQPQPPNKFPYKIAFTAQKGPGSPISVSITGNSGNQIQGFQIQARDVNTNKIVGSFQESNDSNIQFLGCEGAKNTASHTSKENKNKVSAVWQPDGFSGQINFHVTVVKTYDVFWVNKESDPILVS